MKSELTNKVGVAAVMNESQLPAGNPMKSEIPPVFELKQILVPVDFSRCSRKALQYAIPFARQFGAELTLLHVIEPAVAISMVEVVPQNYLEPKAEAEANLDSFRREVGDDIATKALVRAGSPPVEILDAAKELDAHLIILSTHGRTGLEHVLLGSTVDKVVRRASCPVLVVREHEHEFIHIRAANENDAPG